MFRSPCSENKKVFIEDTISMNFEKSNITITITENVLTLFFFSAFFDIFLQFILFSFLNIYSSFLSSCKFPETELSCHNLKLYLFSGLGRII